ncbi:MAG: hypothetical protein ACRD9S_21790 [Pyrinomonadaceae bacterium]
MSPTRGAGESVKPGVERSGTPGLRTVYEYEPAVAGDSAIEQAVILHQSGIAENYFLSTGCRTLPRADVLNRFVSWGCAPLHPRLYADTHYAG